MMIFSLKSLIFNFNLELKAHIKFYEQGNELVIPLLNVISYILTN